MLITIQTSHTTFNGKKIVFINRKYNILEKINLKDVYYQKVFNETNFLTIIVNV